MSSTPEPVHITASIRFEGDHYWAEVQELPGCFATGDTLDELRDALEEAIAIYLTDDPGGGELHLDLPAPSSVTVDEMKFALA